MVIKYGDRFSLDTKRLTAPLRLFKSKKTQGLEINPRLLPQKGRSSVDPTYLGSLNALMGHYGVVNPYVPIELISYLTMLSVVNPNVSQTIRNMRVMVNTGHKLIIEDKQPRRIDTALERLNRKAYEIYRRSCGVDGLINHYTRQVCVSGALSSEDVLQGDLQGVEKVVIVPVFSVRFKPADDTPYQKTNYITGTGSDLIELNTYTYRYYALDLVENSPYALPPMTAALEHIGIQKDMFKNIKFVMRKLGLLGLNVVKAGKLQRLPNESDEEWKKRNQDYINDLAANIKDNYSDGILVMPDEQDFKNFSVTGDARGIKDLVQVNEEQLITGLGGDPAMYGRSYSTTETYATVTYNKLSAEAGNIRRLIKRRQEGTYLLDLALFGLDVEALSLIFNPNPALNPVSESQAETNRLNKVLTKVKTGMISPQEGANEMGHDDWYDQKLLQAAIERGNTVKEFAFNLESQQYELVRHTCDLGRYRVDHAADRAATRAQRRVEMWVRKYLMDMLPYYDSLSEDVTRYAVDFLKENIDAVSQDSKVFREAVKNYIKSAPSWKVWKDEKFKKEQRDIIVAAGKDFKESDLSAFGGKEPGVAIKFNQGDLAAMEFFAEIDNFLFSKFIDNNDFGSDIKDFIDSFLERGEALHGKWTAEIEDDFLKRFAGALEGDLYYQMDRIVSSAVGRVQSYSHIEQLFEGGFVYAEVVGVAGACSICLEFIGKRFKVADARKISQALAKAKSVSAALEYIKKTNVPDDEEAKKMVDGDEIKIHGGRGFPTYHVKCHCGIRGVVDET